MSVSIKSFSELARAYMYTWANYKTGVFYCSVQCTTRKSWAIFT